MSSRLADGAVGSVLSALLRCPEVMKLRYDAASGSLVYSLAVEGDVSAQCERVLSKRVRGALDALFALDRLSPSVVEFRQERLGKVSRLHMERDVATMSPEEVYLTVDLVSELMGERLVMESGGTDEDGVEEDMLGSMLEALHEGKALGSRLMACRESGRVLLFHK